MVSWTGNFESNSMAKGLTFSLITFILVGILMLIVYYFYAIQEISIKKTYSEKEYEFVNKILNFVKSDLSNFLEISIPRILNSIISYEIENGIFVDDVRNVAKNALFYSQFLDQKILIQNSSLIDYENRLNTFLSKYNVSVKIYPIDFGIYHSDSFKIYVNLSLIVSISYKKFSLSSLEIVERNVSILGFEDPFYVINSNGLASNRISTKKFDYFVSKDLEGNGSGIILAKTIILFDKNAIQNLNNKINYILVTKDDSQISSYVNQFAGVILERNYSLITIPHAIGNISKIKNESYYVLKNGNAYNVNNLVEILQNQLCFESNGGASFLDRLEGRNRLSNKYALNNNVGLECFVNKEYLALSGLNVTKERTNIDYLYFSSEQVTSYKISGFKDFYIDSNHISKYQLDGLIE